MPSKTRGCVIGAGPSGVTTLRALQSLEDASGSMDSTGYEVVCYERYDSIGGIWNFKGREGIEKDGIEAHSGMYENLRTNNPKEVIELPELKMPQDKVEDTKPCYPERSNMLKYLQSFALKFRLEKYIKFNTWVQNVSFDQTTKKFSVKVKDLVAQQEEIETFDYVIVATGHFNYPNDATYPGQETFKGKIIHSKQFIDGSRYKGKRVLVVGSSFSAEDIAMHSLRAGAQYVTISYKTKPQPLNYPGGIDVRPLLENIDGNTVSFQDGSKEEYDVIIYCTGYVHNFPFMEDDLKLKTGNRLAVPLYKQVVFPDNPKLFYIGMQNQFYTYPMFWLQGHLCAKIIKGELDVPLKPEMLKEIEQKQFEESQLRNYYEGIDFQTDHVNELAKITGQIICDKSKLMKQWIRDRNEDFQTFREQTHFDSTFNILEN
ncbi:trimethylamine monooxygenase-like [Symsagittifera roscoffensis]|uniref:trimethylamine monooxygenase-like n=1 Tax=Symsagittifera roscoffensis TaxID=84072 RepID=UPI00307C3774